MEQARGILFDCDGVLYVGNEPVKGAVEILQKIDAAGIPYRFITNTSTKTVHEVGEKLRGLGFQAPDHAVFSAISATRDYLAARGRPRVHLLMREAAKPDFEPFPVDEENPEFVVIGDIGAAWDYELLNRVFNHLDRGAELLAVHKNKFWQTSEGLRMDIGAFVAGLEYVSGKTATVLGKPSPDFFRLAVESLECDPASTAIVGDDIENDVGGGQAIGMSGIQVRTGKFRESQLETSGIRPDMILDSVADLAAHLGI